MPQGLISAGFVPENLNLELQCWPLYIGSFAFVTSGTTVTVKVPKDFRKYHVVGFAWNGRPDDISGEILSVPAPNSDGTNSAEGSEGAYYITITRAGTAQASGLSGTITIRGVCI